MHIQAGHRKKREFPEKPGADGAATPEIIIDFVVSVNSAEFLLEQIEKAR